MGKATNNKFIDSRGEGEAHITRIMKGLESTGLKSDTTVFSGQDKTIIVFSGDFDKVMASFIIANGALAMGRKVTMFFTFWGLNVLRRRKNVKVKKLFMEKCFHL